MTDSFVYYMVRIRRSRRRPPTGHGARGVPRDRREGHFGCGEDLVRLVAAWPADEESLA